MPPGPAPNPLQADIRRRQSQRILVVDDLSSMRKLIRAILQQMGFQNILEASNGADALKQLSRSPVDLLICDWNMPGMTGLEVLVEVRKQERLSGLPVLLVTAEKSGSQVKEAVDAGVTSYVVKPFLPVTLSAHVLKCLGKGADKPVGTRTAV